MKKSTIYIVYLLKSLVVNKSYVGFTNNLPLRLKQHNNGKSRYTNLYKPWEVIYTENYITLEEARKREKYLKTAAGRKFLKKVFQNYKSINKKSGSPPRHAQA